MQRPIGAALDLKNPGFSGGCQARWPSWQDRQVPRWFVSKDSRCEASWLSRNTAATQHLHRTVVWTSHVLSVARIPCPIGSSVCCVEKHSYFMGAIEFPHSMVFVFPFSPVRIVGISYVPHSNIPQPLSPQPPASQLYIVDHIEGVGNWAVTSPHKPSSPSTPQTLFFVGCMKPGHNPTSE